jgi:lipoprotein-anchoring transpeptidase ErfK/SrfK
MHLRTNTEPDGPASRTRSAFPHRSGPRSCSKPHPTSRPNHKGGDVHRMNPPTTLRGLDPAARNRARGLARNVAVTIAVISLTLASAVTLEAGAGASSAGGAIVRPVSTGPPVPEDGQSAAPSVVAAARASSVAVYASPTSRNPSHVLSSPTSSGDPLIFLVTGPLGATWLHVYLPERPNDSEGWIHTDAVTLSADDYFIAVNLSTHQMTVFSDEHQLMSLSIGEGRTALPTPTGRFFIVDLLKQPDPSGEYGPYAFGLSAFSDVLQSFGGGPGEIGIHGTDNPKSVGASISHGCIRVPNATIVALAALLPLGTPVLISH